MRGPELDFLLDGVRALSLGETPSMPDALDPERLTALCVRHGMASLVRTWLLKDHPADEPLQQIAGLAQVRSMAGSAALGEISAALGQKGIRHLAFKGPSTAIRLYGDVAHRPFLDIDLLVEEQPRAQSIVEGIGFELDARINPRHLARIKSKHLSHVRDSVRLELHNEMLGYSGAEGGASFDDYWERRADFELGGTAIPCLGWADTVYHGAIHGTGHAFLSLKWLADTAAMIRHDRGWDQATTWALERRMVPAFLCGPALIADLGGAVPASPNQHLASRSRMLNKLTAVSRESWERTHGDLFLLPQRLRMLPLDRRIREVAVMAFRPTASDWELLPWIPPDTPIVFNLIRPFRVAAKYARRLVTN